MAKIIGRDRLRYVLTQIPKELRKELRDTVAEAADYIVQDQRRLAPYRSGDLRASIVATPADYDPPRYASLRSKKVKFPDPELAVIISAGNEQVRYAHMVEFGTPPHTNLGRFPGTHNPGTPPRPFFYPAWRANRKRALSKINRAAHRAIKQGIR